jgi:hypothetical protein
MAAWAKSERTSVVDAGGALVEFAERPLFLADCKGLALAMLCASAPDPSKLRVKKSVSATVLYLAEEGSGVVAEFTSRNHACAVSPGA